MDYASIILTYLFAMREQHEVNTWEVSTGKVQMFFGYEGTKIASF